jgi:hypothetical protein
MNPESIIDNRKAAMDAARRRLARLKLASVTTSVLAMGGMATAIAQQAGAYPAASTAASATAQVVGSVARSTAAQSATASSAATTAPSPSPSATASSAPAIVSAQS